MCSFQYGLISIKQFFCARCNSSHSDIDEHVCIARLRAFDFDEDNNTQQFKREKQQLPYEHRGWEKRKIAVRVFWAG